MYISDEKAFGKEFLDDIVTWISENLYLNEVFPKERIVEWVKENMEPEEVFSYETLELWAENNNFVTTE